MPGLNKIEDYLISLGVSYEEPQSGTWLVEDPGKGLPGSSYPTPSRSSS